MKIFLPFQSQDIGGTSVFSEKFKAGMSQRGHEIFFDYRADYDILFLIAQAPFRYLIEAKRKKKPIIQRLDGMWYWSVAGWKYPLYNLKAQIIRQFFADFTIYQSKYSKYCAEKFLGKKHLDPSTIIYNGVDLHLFSPEGPKIDLRDNSGQTIFFSSSAFRREDQIVPILEALKYYEQRYGSNFKFVIVGTFTGKVAHIPKNYAGFKQAVFLGRINNRNLPAYERSADVYVITHLNPPCPNNVIEALACGLPVCGVTDGAMNELVESGKSGLLLKTEGDAFWKIRTLDLEHFADNLHILVDKKNEYSRESRRSALERFSLDTMLKKYTEALEYFTCL